MSLQYIIDGYNLLNHPLASRILDKYQITPSEKILALIRRSRLTGSPRNTISIVFDGYPPAGHPHRAVNYAEIIFAEKKSADEKIKMMVENSANRKNIFVVSDDKEIRFIVRACGARPLAVENFINPERGAKKKIKDDDSSELKLKLSQIDQINKEFRRIWLE